MVGQIGAGNVNKASLLVHLSGWQRAYELLKQSVMGEPNCWLYIHTCDVKLRGRRREGDEWGKGGRHSVNVFVSELKRTKQYYIISEEKMFDYVSNVNL